MEPCIINWNTPPPQRSVEEQIGSLNKEERQCFDELRSFWDNSKMDVKFSDYQILRFARCSPGKFKFNPETAKKSMVNYAAWSKRVKLDNMTIHRVRFELERNVINVPGLRDVDGNHMFIFRPSFFHPAKDNLNEFLKSMVYVLETITSFEDACTNGICIIATLEGWGWSNFSVQASRNIINTLQGRFPLRLRKLAVFDSPMWIGTAFNLMRPIMSADFQSKMKFLKRSQMTEIFRSLDEAPDFLGGKINTTEQHKDFILYRYRMEGLDPSVPYHAHNDDGEDIHDDKVEE